MFAFFVPAITFFAPVAPFALLRLLVTFRFRKQRLVGELELAGLGVLTDQLVSQPSR